MLAGLIFEIIRQNTEIQMTGLEEILLVIIGGSFVVGSMSLLLVFIMKFMQALENRGLFEHIRQKWYRVRNQMIQEIRDRLPNSDEPTS